MGEAYELVIILSIFAETSDRYSHAAFKIAVELSLRTVILLEVVKELLGSGGQLKILRNALEVLPSFEYLLLGGLLLEGSEYCGSVISSSEHDWAICRISGISQKTL